MIRLIEQFYMSLKSLFLRGFLTIIPITATIVITHAGYTTISHWLAPLKKYVPSLLANIPGIEFAVITFFILAVGALLRLFVFAPVIHYSERIINKIPLVRIIYSSAKILVDFFSLTRHGNTGKQVVLVPFPYKTSYKMAFLLGPADYLDVYIPKPAETPDAEYCRVFMPHSPNPTSGFFLIIPKADIIPTDLSFEDALKAIVSCGIYIPPHHTK